MTHYFDEGHDSGERRHIEVSIWGQRRRFVTAPGVFSSDGLDHATKVLLDHSVAPAPGSSVLDLGCGWGALACALAANGSRVWAVDVNPLALTLTRENAEGLDVAVSLPDEVPSDLAFDAIWSNPPIRIGKKALHELLLRWLPRLAPGGEARLVVGKNLGADSLQRWLIEQGFPTERVASSRGFRVLSVHAR